MNKNHIDIIAKLAQSESNIPTSKDKWFEDEEFQAHKIVQRINEDRYDFGNGISIPNKKKLFADLERMNYLVRHQINSRRVAYHINYVKIMNEYLDYIIENEFSIYRYQPFQIEYIKRMKKTLNKKKAVIYKRDKDWTKHALKKISTLHDLKLLYQKILASLLAVNLLRAYGRANTADNMIDVFSKITDSLWYEDELDGNGAAIKYHHKIFEDHGRYILDKIENEKL